MKMKVQFIAWLLPVVLFAGCQFDNYDPPSYTLEGNIVYQQDPVPVSYNNVTFELWQSGFGKMTPINVTVDQDGSYTALLFEGDYKLVFPVGQGPFMSQINQEADSDTLLVQVRGDQTLDIEVMPYYMIRNPQFSVSGRTVTANCGLEQIITDGNAKGIDNVSLYVSTTRYVDTRTSIVTHTVNGADITDMSDVSLNVDVPELTPTQDYVFARIGVKITDVEDMIFSTVEKVQLN